jgi:hypothetical protein
MRTKIPAVVGPTKFPKKKDDVHIPGIKIDFLVFFKDIDLMNRDDYFQVNFGHF